MSDPLAHRKKLSFEQAEGITPLPTQLARGEISQQFRAVLWSLVKEQLDYVEDAYGFSTVCEPWLTILRDAHILRDHMVSDFAGSYHDTVDAVRDKIASAPWHESHQRG